MNGQGDQTGTDLAPSESQVRMLEQLQGKDYACTVVDACAACKIGRRTFYNWFDNPAFARWWGGQTERWAALQAGRVYGALVRSAAGEDVGGNATDRKTYLERFDAGYAPKQRREHLGGSRQPKRTTRNYTGCSTRPLSVTPRGPTRNITSQRRLARDLRMRPAERERGGPGSEA